MRNSDFGYFPISGKLAELGNRVDLGSGRVGVGQMPCGRVFLSHPCSGKALENIGRKPAQRQCSRQIFLRAFPEHGWLRNTLPEGIYPMPTLPDPKSTLYVEFRAYSGISENTQNSNSA